MACEQDSNFALDFTKLFQVGEPGDSREFRVNSKGNLSSDRAYKLTRGEIPPERIELHWSMGRLKPADIIGTELSILLIVSEKVKRILESEKITGWKTYPVSIFGKDHTEVPGYHGLSIFGRCGQIDNRQSVKIDKVFPGGIFPVWRGLFFDPGSWDGSDFFMPDEESGHVFVSEKVKSALEKAQANNIEFTALTDIERNKI